MTGVDPEVVREFELETWTRCAGSYLDTFANLTNAMIPALGEAAEIDSESRALDLGSGPGNVARVLSEAGADVTGIDFSQQMVDHASATNPGITFKPADVGWLSSRPILRIRQTSTSWKSATRRT